MYRLFVLPVFIFAPVVIACDLPPEESSDTEWVVSSYPEEGASDVSRIGMMSIKLDRRVYPQSVDRISVQISSGDIFSWLYVYFEPVTRQIVIGLFPDRPLEPFVTYRLVVQGIVDLDGEIQPEMHPILFRTGSRLDGPDPIPAVEWSRINGILKRSCASTNCHAGPTPALGLDLSSATWVQQTAINATSNELPMNMISAEGARGMFSFSSFRIIEVGVTYGQPAGSYMMYKVLDDSHIVGFPMPPPDSNFKKLDKEELEALSTWILYGAVTQSVAW